MNDESTPKGAHESATTALMVAADTDFTAEDRLASFTAGLEIGLALRCDKDTTEAQHEARHARVRPVVDTIERDMRIRGVGDHAQLQANRRAHQIEACERYKAEALEAEPWPTESAPPPGP